MGIRQTFWEQIAAKWMQSLSMEQQRQIEQESGRIVNHAQKILTLHDTKNQISSALQAIFEESGEDDEDE